MAEYLFSSVDRYDWGYNKPGQPPSFVTDNGRLESFFQKLPGVYPQRLTRTFVQRHLTGSERLHYTSHRASGFAFIMIDVDAHAGQDDAFKLASWIQARYFPTAYLEPSRRGWHLYVLFRVKKINRRAFNWLAEQAEAALGVLAKEHQFESTLEIRGTFTEVDTGCIQRRGKLAAAPGLPNGLADLDRLTEASVFFPSALHRLIDDASAIQQNPFVNPPSTATGSPNTATKKRRPRTTPGTLQDVCVLKTKSAAGQPLGGFRKLDTADAYERMAACGWDFTVVHRRLPEDVDELLRSYAGIYGDDDSKGLADRRRRAADVLKRRAETFRWDLAQEGGYEYYREQLIEAVSSHCIDRKKRYQASISDEDLAVALYVVQRNSFGIADRPIQQFTCGYEAFAGMFRELKAEGVIRRGGCDRNKIAAMKAILVRAGLIQCVDPGYIAAGKRRGVCMKYTIGPKHWRYAAFNVYRETVEVKFIRRRSETLLAAA
ncbi:hypothetical protein [Humisphaera borealis]|uniref:Uncharacterized protein n=1 Tax=Humisphaera borealis TaxID=2807512 RepID=A0A7M2WZ33_9BACT|nr:hypothetical protein [Humisphaera borealis]QOV90653.1 hypothetical protein IPV69_04630 [Humisphaera borealis]